MPAQTKPHGDQTGRTVDSLKDEATDQFGKLADQATETFRCHGPGAAIRRAYGRAGS